ncbi:dITP/XTP pyrophosphatase [Frankliniella fusca]|uniref:DITP/XTP pyrophosphatase n=1 Tax=Frankliniella fusca TaxID=407009 RepID=A0AAE1HMM3_9NEOP|nr:dITP/XTP pyrophosphatase [Frankliniella fusca]
MVKAMTSDGKHFTNFKENMSEIKQKRKPLLCLPSRGIVVSRVERDVGSWIEKYILKWIMNFEMITKCKDFVQIKLKHD